MANRYDGLSRRAHVHTLDLRGFRLSLVPPLTLPQAAAGAQVDKAMLSRFETGRRAITGDCARHLARFYSAWTGREVTAGEILDLADRTRARCLLRSLRSRRRRMRGLLLVLLGLGSRALAAEPVVGIHPSVAGPTCIRVEANTPAIDPLRYQSGAPRDLSLALTFSTEACPGQETPPAAPACLLMDGSIGQTANVYTTGAPADVYLRLRIWTVPCPPAEAAPAQSPKAAERGR